MTKIINLLTQYLTVLDFNIDANDMSAKVLTHIIDSNYMTSVLDNIDHIF